MSRLKGRSSPGRWRSIAEDTSVARGLFLRRHQRPVITISRLKGFGGTLNGSSSQTNPRYMTLIDLAFQNVDRVIESLSGLIS